MEVFTELIHCVYLLGGSQWVTHNWRTGPDMTVEVVGVCFHFCQPLCMCALCSLVESVKRRVQLVALPGVCTELICWGVTVPIQSRKWVRVNEWMNGQWNLKRDWKFYFCIFHSSPLLSYIFSEENKQTTKQTRTCQWWLFTHILQAHLKTLMLSVNKGGGGANFGNQTFFLIYC